jgi:hypothetical protein
MSHLSPETMARLVEDAPNTEESAHLEACASCRAELEAMTEDVNALRMLPDMAVAPDQWAVLERRLVDEGLIRTPATTRAAGGMRTMQIAAALVLFLGGSLAGRMTAEPGVVTVTQRAPAATVDPAPTATDPAQTVVLDAPVVEPLPSVQPAPSNVALAADAAPVRAPARTAEEAAQQLRQTEQQYLDALTRYAELATQSQSGDPVARLAALQSIIMTTQAALSQTPTDPVINGYHLTALAQRDATLRQVAATSGDRWY